MTETILIADRAVLPDRVAVRARVAVADGRVRSVDQDPAGDGARRLEGTLLPGLVDLQVNGGGGRSVDEATDDALDAVAKSVQDGGAVAFLPTLITAPWERLLEQVAAVARWIARCDGASAEPLGLHVEGPFLSVSGAHDEACFLDPNKERIEALLRAADGQLRLVTLAHDRPGAADAVRRLRGEGVAVSLGHVRDTKGMRECIDAGAGLVTHLFNAMGPLHHREPGVAGLALDERALRCALIADGAHVHPAMVRNAFAVLGPDRLVLTSDAVAAAGMPDGDYALAGMRVRSERGVVRDDQGRLAGSALTMGHAVQNLLEMVPNAGAWTAARAASTNPAHVLGIADLGHIAPDARAAFTLLGADGTTTALRL